MKPTESKLHSIVHGVMVEMGLVDRPATCGEIVRICQTVLAEVEGRNVLPLAPKLVVPDEPDEASAKQILFAIMWPFVLENQLNEIPRCRCGIDLHYKRPELFIRATFAEQDQIRAVLTEFGVCPKRRKRLPPYWRASAARCHFRMILRLPEDWRNSRWHLK